MELKASAETVNRIWQQLNNPYSPGRRDGRRTAHVDVLKEGWAAWHDIEDVLWEMDSRADVIARFNEDLNIILDAFKLHLTHRYRGPFSQREVYGHQALSSTDVAVLLMEVERLGFSVDATNFVEALRPKFVRQKYLTNSELSVLWHGRMRHRSEMLVLKSEDASAVAHETIKTHSGYRATALLTEKRTATVLRIDAPKRRGDLRLDWWIQMGLRHHSAMLG